MKIGKSNYNRVGEEMLCPICGKHDWCLVSDNGDYAICARVESRFTVGEAGWRHKLDCDNYKLIKKVIKSKDYVYDNKYIMKVYKKLDFHPKSLIPLAKGLKVPKFALLDMGVGYDKDIWYFPMRNEKKQIT